MRSSSAACLPRSASLIADSIAADAATAVSAAAAAAAASACTGGCKESMAPCVLLLY